MPTTVLCCVGTRPEVIKMAPVIRALQAAPWARCRVLATAQHRHLLDQMLEFFGLSADIDLNVMTANQRLPELTAQLIVRLDRTLAEEKPDIVLAQGDTTTVFTAALAAFYRRIPFGHVEAGLRSHNLASPFPEEANRLLAGHLSALHFAPTPKARANLLREGIADERIHVTGNTVIDALLTAAETSTPIGVPLDPSRRLILVTAHRRDSFGEPIRQVCTAVREICVRHPDVQVLWPVHPNPQVRPVVESILNGVPHIHLCEPLSYGPFVTAMKQATLILTDSGGVQEEAPALGKPVLVMRNESERPEAIEAGVAMLVGPNHDRIVTEAGRLLSDPVAYARMARGASPYGDGRAAERIVQAIGEFTGKISKS
ncbi:MAG TPA: UDP-N-acetylglucosamine 2-epimerase (non-hydrolyzing) [Phycisphaerae bacterium]|nr:UDP-N-acetylglucosamine 2-epimerase (non-hydrolyzing) [Phycisphaerae bacterium]HOB74063.1 UDP-N-acetylglucosamine 2-epimerase (non-hydrolyzing) [Phycisphaerae bacterium]HOL25411.1 UDP-N-acetylglucosamine 2-epimerase (non-hydrolyzing) [Phycisphaerae bacterium]HPP22087.1 UDP-N-acetylglucosamine 2-epimerase (non-hydrolyzing) [Phycisphaerae bacterium]HPU31162.1 UDP-N-acetylglucosamine 2-epimerase (non-hydrolyzing) [Phycisphaerae bacterium]